jgi:hypothetical protein
MSAAERLANPEAVFSRSDLRELGYERRAVDAKWPFSVEAGSGDD